MLVLTAHGDIDFFYRAARAGAAEYVLKDISVRNLAVAIRAVHRGETMINPGITQRLLTDLAAGCGETQQMPLELTDREMEILIDVAHGLTDKD